MSGCNGSSNIVREESNLQVSHSTMFLLISLGHSALSGLNVRMSTILAFLMRRNLKGRKNGRASNEKTPLQGLKKYIRPIKRTRKWRPIASKHINPWSHDRNAHYIIRIYYQNSSEIIKHINPPNTNFATYPFWFSEYSTWKYKSCFKSLALCNDYMIILRHCINFWLLYSTEESC